MVTLSPAPYYANLSSAIGGGAVGHVPYTVHSEDCSPPNGDPFEPEETVSVVIAHYGPVWWDPQTQDAPFTIEWAVAGTGNWYTLPEEDFTYTRGANKRDVTITAETTWDFTLEFDYRIKPNRSVLMCEINEGGSNTIPVVAYTYILFGD